MSYRVFARKYRPQTFEQVVGQDHITRTLQNAIANQRLAQAYLFVGPRGIGKTSTARILAKALNCVNGPTISPCGVCDACKEIAEGNSLDVLEIDGASNNSVDHIRELRENAAFAPARGPYKIYLVDEVHMLSTAAFNALLKTLEEPPAHVKFIFATTESQKVPATITSRCQRFDLRRIPAALIAAHLQAIATNEGITLEDDAAQSVAKGADGGLRDAESMLDQLVAFCGEKITADDVLTVFGFTSKETVDSLCGALFRMDAASALEIIGSQSDAGKDLSRLMGDVIGYIRDLLVAQSTPDSSRADTPPLEKLLVLLDHFAEAESRLRWASDKRLYFDVAVIKAVHLLDQTSLSDVIDTLAALGEGRDVARQAPERSVAEHPTAVAASKPAAPAKSVPLPSVARTGDSPSDAAPPPKSTPIETLPPSPVPQPTPSHPASNQEKVLSNSAPSGKESLKPSDMIWRESVETLSSESFIRFGWLTQGQFIEDTGNAFRIEFPRSLTENTQDFFWLDLKKQVEEMLAKKLAKKVAFHPEFTGAEIPEAPTPTMDEEPNDTPSPTPESRADTPEPADTQEAFQNDPKIRMALEIFKAKIEESKL